MKSREWVHWIAHDFTHWLQSNLLHLQQCFRHEFIAGAVRAVAQRVSKSLVSPVSTVYVDSNLFSAVNSPREIHVAAYRIVVRTPCSLCSWLGEHYKRKENDASNEGSVVDLDCSTVWRRLLLLLSPKLNKPTLISSLNQVSDVALLGSNPCGVVVWFHGCSGVKQTNKCWWCHHYCGC